MPKCPWCGTALDKQLVRNLGNVPQSAPCCGKPITKSVVQLLVDVLLFLPLSALVFYLSLLAYESGKLIGPIAGIIVCCVVAVYIHRFFPIVHGPRRGFGSRDS